MLKSVSQRMELVMKGISCLILCVLGVSLSGFAGPTLGQWVFNGTPDAVCPAGTEIPNQIAGSALKLTVGNSAAEGTDPKFVTDVPGGCIYADWTMSAKVANLTTSIRLDSDASRDVGNYLRVTGLKAALAGKDFHIELIARPDARYAGNAPYGYGDDVVMGISGPSESVSPQVYYGEYNRGVFAIAAYEPAANRAHHVQVAPLSWVSNEQASYAFLDDNWHQFVLEYTVADKTMRMWTNNRRDHVDHTWPSDGINTELTLEDDTFFQILGTIGRFYKCYSGMTVAALRIVEGAYADRKDGFRVTNGREISDDGVIGWWRFAGEVGSPFSAIPNEVSNVPEMLSYYLSDSMVPAYALDAKGSRTTRATGYEMVCAASPKAMLKMGDNLSVMIPNGSVAYNAIDGQSIDYRQGGFNVLDFQEMTLRGSFTVECFCLFETNICRSLGGNGRTVLIGESTGMNDGYDLRWDLAFFPKDDLVVSALLTDGSSVTAIDIPTPQLNVWHHLALVYDESVTPATLKLYVDYKTSPQCSYTLPEGAHMAHEPTTGRLHLAGAPTRGKNGGYWGGLDEVRYTLKALEPSQFLRMSNGGGFMLKFK